MNDPVTLQHLPFPLTVKGRLNKTGTLIILKCCPAGQNEHLGCLSQRGLLQQTASDWIASKQHQAQETACLVTCGLARGGASVRPPKTKFKIPELGVVRYICNFSARKGGDRQVLGLADPGQGACLKSQGEQGQD